MLWGVTYDEAEPYARRQLERRAVDVALLNLFGVKLPTTGQTPAAGGGRVRGVGEACRGTLLPVCQPKFGDKLPVLCRTCPGPRKG